MRIIYAVTVFSRTCPSGEHGWVIEDSVLSKVADGEDMCEMESYVHGGKEIGLDNAVIVCSWYASTGLW